MFDYRGDMPYLVQILIFISKVWDNSTTERKLKIGSIFDKYTQYINKITIRG